eukprot:6182934-Pleurochrysis_carterae.AAC.1
MRGRLAALVRAVCSDTSSRRHVLSVYVRRERLGEDVGRVVIGVDLAHLVAPVRHVIAHLQILPIDMSRALTRSALLRQLDRSAVVD